MCVLFNSFSNCPRWGKAINILKPVYQLHSSIFDKKLYVYRLDQELSINNLTVFTEVPQKRTIVHSLSAFRFQSCLKFVDLFFYEERLSRTGQFWDSFNQHSFGVDFKKNPFNLYLNYFMFFLLKIVFHLVRFGFKWSSTYSINIKPFIKTV